MVFDSSFQPILRFAVMSDIHYKDEPSVERVRMDRAIQLMYALAEKSRYPSIDAFYVVGDFANSGSVAQMEAFKASLSGLKPETQVTLTMASHEYRDGEDTALERFNRIFGMETDTHKVINGFHFIALTTTRGCRFSDEKIAWAKKELQKAAQDDPKKPIFFFQHPHISGTVYGSINWGEDDLYAALMDYPQIINFSGHSHAPINDPRSIHQQHFTSLGTGSLSYFELDEFDKIYGTVPPDADRCAQFLFVEADKEGNVRIYPYDILTEEFFPQTWKIDRPYDRKNFLYTTAKRTKEAALPYFGEDDRAVVSDITENSFTLTFPQAKCATDRVNSYDLLIFRDDTDTAVRQISFWSGYYLHDMPKEIRYTVTDIPSDTLLRFEIYANGFWNNTAAKPLTGIVKTK